MDATRKASLEKESQTLRADLKHWEHQWNSQHGTKPSRNDIKAAPEIARKYKDYNRLRDVLSGKLKDESSTKRKAAEPAHTPVKRMRYKAVPDQEAVPVVSTPSADRTAPSPAPPTSIGPTPHRDGKVLGLFAFLEETPQKTPSKGPADAAGLETPSKAVQEDVEAKLGRTPGSGDGEAGGHDEFAVPFSVQMSTVTKRVFAQYWRQPAYIASKFMLGAVAGLFIGFSFVPRHGTLAGMQTVLFSVFMIITIFSTLVQQIHPHFLTQRSLYEVRERPSKAYSWVAFMMANLLVEIPYQIITAILIYACFYYPVVGVQSSDRQGLVLLYCIQLFLYASSFAAMTIAALPDALTASSIVTLLVIMSLTFCGVMQTPDALPTFWTFMYHLSPFTYWVSGIVSTMLHGRPVECSAAETAIFSPPAGQSCGEYMRPYLQQAPGTLQNPDATADCRYCSLSVADQFMAGSEIYWDDRWRNFGIVWGYILFNFGIAVATYWAFRVKKWKKA